jgi:hypothetical protein
MDDIPCLNRVINKNDISCYFEKFQKNYGYFKENRNNIDYFNTDITNSNQIQGKNNRILPIYAEIALPSLYKNSLAAKKNSGMDLQSLIELIIPDSPPLFFGPCCIINVIYTIFIFA